MQLEEREAHVFAHVISPDPPSLLHSLPPALPPSCTPSLLQILSPAGFRSRPTFITRTCASPHVCLQVQQHIEADAVHARTPLAVASASASEVAELRAKCADQARAATSAPGLDPPLPHLRRDWAHPLPQLRRDSSAVTP